MAKHKESRERDPMVDSMIERMKMLILLMENLSQGTSLPIEDVLEMTIDLGLVLHNFEIARLKTTNESIVERSDLSDALGNVLLLRKKESQHDLLVGRLLGDFGQSIAEYSSHILENLKQQQQVLEEYNLPFDEETEKALSNRQTGRKFVFQLQNHIRKLYRQLDESEVLNNTLKEQIKRKELVIQRLYWEKKNPGKIYPTPKQRKLPSSAKQEKLLKSMTTKVDPVVKGYGREL